MKRLEDMTEPELRHVCNTIARGIEETAQQLGMERPLFALVLFNDPKVGQYVCNCERATMIEALKETVARLARREDVGR